MLLLCLSPQRLLRRVAILTEAVRRDAGPCTVEPPPVVSRRRLVHQVRAPPLTDARAPLDLLQEGNSVRIAAEHLHHPVEVPAYLSNMPHCPYLELAPLALHPPPDDTHKRQRDFDFAR